MDSRRVSRAPRYSGTGFESSWFSLTRLSRSMVPISIEIRLTTGLVTLLLPALQPRPIPKDQPVWALPRSLATTSGITIVFSSFGY